MISAIQSALPGELTLLACIKIVVATSLVYAIARSLYNIFFHPLRRFPGPRTAAATRFYYDIITASGAQAAKTNEWHHKYGEIVRIAPNQLSFIHESAWRDIYMHQQGKPQLQKAEFMPVRQRAYDLLTAPDDVHSRQRKMISHAFSDRNLREQEAMLVKYVDMFIANLQDDAQCQRPVDMCKEYNYITFDVVGDFAFGESFGGLEQRRAHPYIKLVFENARLLAKLSAFAAATGWTPLIRKLVRWAEPLAAFDPREYVHNKVGARIAAGENRPDLMSNILRAKSEFGDQLPREEIDAIVTILLGAGTETTATLLSGLTWELHKRPDVLARLKAEIRSEFGAPADLTLLRLGKLPYLNAVITEALRIFPPLPVAMPRIASPGGSLICGHMIPEGTVVGVPFVANQHSPANFAAPLEFHPERWLTDAPAQFKHDKKHTLQPFSAGPRNCIGRNLALAEIKLITARFLFQFDFEVQKESRNWHEHLVYIIWEKKPLLLKLTDRFA